MARVEGVAVLAGVKDPRVGPAHHGRTTSTERSTRGENWGWGKGWG